MDKTESRLLKEMIEEVDIDLLLTNIGDKETGELYVFSDEMMEMFNIFWKNFIKKELLSKLNSQQKQVKQVPCGNPTESQTSPDNADNLFAIQKESEVKDE